MLIKIMIFGTIWIILSTISTYILNRFGIDCVWFVASVYYLFGFIHAGLLKV